MMRVLSLIVINSDIRTTELFGSQVLSRRYTPTIFNRTCCPWSHGLQSKKALSYCGGVTSSSRVPSQRSLDPSVMSVANDKGDNEMIPGDVHRSPGICLITEENVTKTSARKPSD